MIRRGNNLLQVCKQMAALSGGQAKETNEKVDLMRRVMGVMQHHDAVTGTAKQAVTFDYQERFIYVIQRSTYFWSLSMYCP